MDMSIGCKRNSKISQYATPAEPRRYISIIRGVKDLIGWVRKQCKRTLGGHVIGHHTDKAIQLRRSKPHHRKKRSLVQNQGVTC